MYQIRFHYPHILSDIYLITDVLAFNSIGCKQFIAMKYLEMAS